MDRRNDHMRVMEGTGVVAIVRLGPGAPILDVVRAMRKGGVRAVEITMTTPDALDAIEATAREFGEDTIVGVGSVLDSETARAAILAGAEFVVSPTLNPDVIRTCQRYSKIALPGAYTPTEIMTAWEAGADAVKVFPAATLGPDYFRAVLAPMPQVKLTPTGGVDESTIPEWMRAGAAFVAVGSALTPGHLIEERDWSGLTERAARILGAVQEGRK